jgi:hypothetical protein
VGQTFNPFRLFTGIFIPEAMVRYPHLSPSSKLAYGRLVRYAGEDGRCFPAVKTLAKEIGLRERRTRSCLAELESAAFIRRDIQPGRTTAFVFLWHQVFSGESPRQKNAAPTRRDPAVPTRRDPAAEDSQHQESQSKESQFPAQAVRIDPLQQGARNSDSTKIDDERAAPTSSPEKEFRARLTQRHGAAIDPERVLEDVKAELGNSSFSKFLDADRTATSAPSRLTNPHGHYRKLARRIAREQKTQVLAAILETQERARQAIAVENLPFTPNCANCKDGLRPDGQYCGCMTGDTRRKLDAFQRRKTEPPVDPSEPAPKTKAEPRLEAAV